MTDQHPIPVTILTGFLGAGKTTLLNQILKTYKSKSFAIIENEFGDINIDSNLIKTTSKTGVYELTNGCICCSINAELGLTLNSIIVSGQKYDHLIVEATGIAAPAEIVHSFIEGARVQKYFRLDSVVCLVDAVNFLDQKLKYSEPAIQISQSDTILLNKSDLASKEQIDEIKTIIKRLNPFANIYISEFGIADDCKILNSEAYQPQKIEKSIIDFTTLSVATTVAPSKQSKHDIEAIGIEIEGDFDLERIANWIEGYLYVNTANILRIKGILSITDMKHKIVLQSVSDNFQVQQGSLWQEGEPRKSKIVFIGSQLDKDDILKNMSYLQSV